MAPVTLLWEGFEAGVGEFVEVEGRVAGPVEEEFIAGWD